MEEIFYTRDHYCLLVDNDTLTVSLTSFILDHMSIINFVELPTIGSICSKTEWIGQINYNDDDNFHLHSVFSGRIIDINDSLMDNCEQLFSNDLENSWLYRLCPASRTEMEGELMSKEDYEEYLEKL
jgi:glycine cleavage system H lipoate-binding protein